MMHTVTLRLTETFDVDKLIALCRGKQARRVSIHRINLLGIGKSRRSGFSKRRYAAADLQYPLILTQQMELLDGRHRYFKAKDLGKKFVTVVIVTYDELLSCSIER